MQDFSPFNSPFEAGLRAMCVLERAADHAFSLDQMLAFDHLVVHTGDIDGGPASLHTATSSRNGELLIRRPLVENGLLLLESRGLAQRQLSKSGIFYSATDFSSVFLDSMTSNYLTELRMRAAWATDLFSSYGEEIFSKIFNMAFDRWATEFQFDTVEIGGRT